MLIASLKPRTMGGTTNTGLLAYAFQRAGRSVALYDADESMQLWAWGRDVEGFPSKVTVAADVDFADETYPGMDPDAINLVDVGHAENHADIVDSVLEVADLVIVTMSPTGTDYARLTRPERGTPLSKMIRRSAALRESGEPPTTVVLLNRCQAGAASPDKYRDKLREDGWTVLTSRIPRREAIASAVGFPCDKPERRLPFDALVTELDKAGYLK